MLLKTYLSHICLPKVLLSEIHSNFPNHDHTELQVEKYLKLNFSEKLKKIRYSISMKLFLLTFPNISHAFRRDD